jgi:integrase
MPAAKRRDDGEGSAYRMTDGRWRAEVTIGWEVLPGGKKKRVRRYVYGKTETEAKAARRDLLTKRAQGELPIGDQVTLGAWMRYWLDEIAVHRVKVKTIESYRVLVDGWIIPIIGDVRLRALQPEHVERLQAAMREGRERTVTTKTGKQRTLPKRPLSASTRLQAHHVLSRALKVAHQRGKVTRNVATLVDAPSVAGRKAEQYLDQAQARALLDMLTGRWNGARWSTALAVGLRQGEALGLLWSDIDLDAGVITVSRQLQRRRGGTLELVPYAKSKAGARPIVLPAPLVGALRAHRKHVAMRKIQLGPEWAGSPLGELVFTTQAGRAIEPRADYEEWRTLLTAIGAPPLRQHAARHTAATLMLTQGVDVKVVAAILGHASTTITRDLYQHVVPELERDAADRMGSALWG